MSDNTLKYDPETVKSALSVLQKEFEAEEGRNRHITSKVQMMLTIAGILLAAITFLMKTIIENKWLVALSIPLLLLAVLIIVYSITLFLKVIQIKIFQRIKYEKLVDNSELSKPVAAVEGRLIATYEEAIQGNTKVVDDMAKEFSKGTSMIRKATFIVFAVLLLIFCINIFQIAGGKL
jgi:hypothetical protein